MVYVNIPYVVENDKLDRSAVSKELGLLNISEDARREAFAAIFNKRPRGVSFNSIVEASVLQRTLYQLGVPFRQSDESEYKYELLP
jgi:hypothetical protein